MHLITYAHCSLHVYQAGIESFRGRVTIERVLVCIVKNPNIIVQNNLQLCNNIGYLISLSLVRKLIPFTST